MVSHLPLRFVRFFSPFLPPEAELISSVAVSAKEHGGARPAHAPARYELQRRGEGALSLAFPWACGDQGARWSDGGIRCECVRPLARSQPRFARVDVQRSREQISSFSGWGHFIDNCSLGRTRWREGRVCLERRNQTWWLGGGAVEPFSGEAFITEGAQNWWR